jgi:hypothetical protein
VYYHVHWERVSKLTEGTWKTEYTAISGEPAKQMPEILKGGRLPGGWEMYDETGDKLSGYFDFENPLAPEKGKKK